MPSRRKPTSKPKKESRIAWFRYIGSGVQYLGGEHRTSGDVFECNVNEIHPDNLRELEELPGPPEVSEDV
jgi:hypothetical protein